MNFAQTITDLRVKIAGVGTRRQELREARAPHALASTQGDSAATAAIAKLDREASQLDGDVQTYEQALEHAEKLKAEAAAAARAEDLARRRAEAQVIGDRMLERYGKIDQLLIDLVRALDESREDLSALRKTKAVQINKLHALERRRTLVVAMRFSGLDAYVDFEHIRSADLKPLTQSYLGLQNIAPERAVHDEEAARQAGVTAEQRAQQVEAGTRAQRRREIEIEAERCLSIGDHNQARHWRHMLATHPDFKLPGAVAGEAGEERAA